jgi:phage minor structural protein
MICIYSQNNTEYSKNGDAVLTPISCTLAVTINSSWQLSLEHPYDAEERYKYIKVGAVIRADINCIRELGSVQQRFRIYQVNKGDNSISAIAFPIGMEASYDAPIDNLNIDGTAQQAITALQAYTQKYTLSTDVTKTARASYANTNLITALASSDASSFLRTWGGELLYDNLNLKIRNRLGDNVAGEHRILYGKNLSSVSHELDDSGLITRIYPISIDGIRLNGTGYVDSDRASQYPVRHARYMQAPYNLIDQNAGSNSRTAVQTRTAIAAITNSASTTSHTACDNALDAGIQPEYIKSIRSDIISAVQTMALTGVVSASLYNAAASVIASSMSWLNELEQPEWSWRGDAETGYWYGNDNSYAKNMYVKISKTWSYFGDDGIWQEPRDDKGTWDWYQDSTGKKYGNFNKYFAHNEYVYITMDGVLTCYWFNEEGWYESEYTEESSWTWHGS